MLYKFQVVHLMLRWNLHPLSCQYRKQRRPVLRFFSFEVRFKVTHFLIEYFNCTSTSYFFLSSLSDILSRLNICRQITHKSHLRPERLQRAILSIRVTSTWCTQTFSTRVCVCLWVFALWSRAGTTPPSPMTAIHHENDSELHKTWNMCQNCRHHSP